MKSKVPFTQYAQYTPLFTVREARERYGYDMHSRSLPNLLHRLKTQGRVRFLANGVYAGALAAAPPNRYRVPRALRDDAVVALHSALELYGVANQVFQTVYYFSAGARKDVVFDHVTYHRVAFPRALAIASHRLFQTELVADNILATGRERSFVDCLLFVALCAPWILARPSRRQTFLPRQNSRPIPPETSARRRLSRRQASREPLGSHLETHGARNPFAF